MNEALLPCPWCGDPVEGHVTEGTTFRWRKFTGCCTDGPEVRHDTMAADKDAAEIDSERRAIAAWNRRAALAAQSGAVEVPDFVEWLKSLQADSYSCSLLVRDALARLATPPRAAAPTEAKPAQDAVDAEQIEAAAKVIAEHMDYPWEHMYEKGRDNMRAIACDAIRAAISAKKGD